MPDENSCNKQTALPTSINTRWRWFKS